MGGSGQGAGGAWEHPDCRAGGTLGTEKSKLPPLWESLGKAPGGILKPPSSRVQLVSVSCLGPSWTGSSPWAAGFFLKVAMDSRTRQLVCWSAGLLGRDGHGQGRKDTVEGGGVGRGGGEAASSHGHQGPRRVKGEEPSDVEGLASRGQWTCGLVVSCWLLPHRDTKPTGASSPGSLTERSAGDFEHLKCLTLGPTYWHPL